MAVKAHWKRRKPGEKTDPESAWENKLLEEQSAGIVHEYRYEPIKLKLCDGTYYIPDYMVLMADGSVYFDECKGSWKAPNQAKSRLKLKMAAELYPWFTFRGVVCTEIPKRDGGGWKFALEDLSGE